MLHPTKSVQHTKNRHLDNMWWSVENHMPQFYSKLGSPQPQDKAFTFSAEQLVKKVPNVAIQVAQPQVCYANPTQDAIDKKSGFVSQSFRSCHLML